MLFKMLEKRLIINGNLEPLALWSIIAVNLSDLSLGHNHIVNLALHIRTDKHLQKPTNCVIRGDQKRLPM